MKIKEAIGIGVGIIFISMAIISFVILSKDNQKGRTEPVLKYEWEQVQFEDDSVQKTLDDLDVKKIQGFLFQENSQTPLYYTVFVGKSPKGADFVKNYFKKSTKFPAGYKGHEESVLKKLGEQNPEIFSGEDLKHQIEINYSKDYVIISYAPQATNVVLDELQQQHFIHRYFRKKKQK